jgi:competence ComEA-like helix-hairpin-helix protein
MNYVTPNRVKQRQDQKEGAGKGTVLFCCALFLIFHIAHFSPASFSSVVSTKQLIAVPSQSLKLVTASDQKQSETRSQSISTGNYHFSPFFFEPIAINYCDKTLLMSIRGIGPSLAESIITTRDTMGSFKTAEDLLQVKGIGPSRLLQFTPYLNFAK